jgi:hypothetical protein
MRWRSNFTINFRSYAGSVVLFHSTRTWGIRYSSQVITMRHRMLPVKRVKRWTAGMCSRHISGRLEQSKLNARCFNKPDAIHMRDRR